MNQQAQLYQASKLLLIFAIKTSLWVILMISMPLIFGLFLILGILWKTVLPRGARRF